MMMVMLMVMIMMMIIMMMVVVMMMMTFPQIGTVYVFISLLECLLPSYEIHSLWRI
jgi:hypothetical protein